MRAQKSLSIGVLLITLFLITAILTGINWINTIEQNPEQASLDKPYLRQIHSSFLEKKMWANYPSVPTSDKLIHIPTLVSIGVLLLMVCISLGYKKHCSSISIGLGCLAVGLIHYLVGTWALSDVGFFGYPPRLWLDVALLGLLYSSAACALFAAMDILRIGIIKTKK
jgi:uncharacterized BrkB/YihY/UPF0761 family membrane protein